MALEFEADGVPIELLPTPAGWRVLIAPVKIKKESKGGIALLDDSVKAAEHFRNVGKVLAIGELAYDDPAFKNGKCPSCKVGDIISYQPHDGIGLTISHNKELHSLRFINDRNVVSVFKDTAAIEELL